MHFTQKLFILLTLTLSPSVSQGSSISADQLESEVSLGQGFDSRTGLFRKHCFVGRKDLIQNQKGSLDHVQEYQSQSDYHRFTLSLSVGIEYLGIGGWLTGGVDRSILTSSYQRTFASTFKFNSPTEILLTPELSEYGKQVSRAQDSSFFRINCGDEVVTRVERGGLYSIFLRLYGDQKKTLEKVKVDFEIDAGISKFTKNIIKKNNASTVDHIRIDLSAHQIGGKRMDLDLLLADKPLPCKVDDQACAQQIDAYLKRLLDYEANFGPSAENSILLVHTTPISQYISGFPLSRAESLSPLEREFLSEVAEKILAMRTQADILELRLIEPDRLEHLRHNEQVLQNIWENCYTLQKGCGQAYASLLQDVSL